jgi:hypothetical protein
MTKVKAFDCVSMKEAIQSLHAKEYAGMTPDEVRRRVEHKLATSDHPAVVWWRAVSSRDAQLR